MVGCASVGKKPMLRPSLSGSVGGRTGLSERTPVAPRGGGRERLDAPTHKNEPLVAVQQGPLERKALRAAKIVSVHTRNDRPAAIGQAAVEGADNASTRPAYDPKACIPLGPSCKNGSGLIG